MTTATKLAYSVKEAAEATGFSPSHIDREIRAGHLKIRRSKKDEKTGEVAGNRVVLAEDLKAWLDALPEG